MEEKTYTGESGTQGFDGFAGLIIGTPYTGEKRADGRVYITLPNDRTTSVSVDQWERWFTK